MIDFLKPATFGDSRRKWALFAAVLATPVVACALWYLIAGLQPQAAPLPPTVPEEPASVDVPLTPPTTYEEHEEYFDIVATYPSMTPLAGSAGPEADARAVHAIRAFGDETIRSFKQQGGFGTLTPEQAAQLGITDERKEALSLSYEELRGPATVSYVYTIAADTLGAHPNAFYRTFTFDRATGKELALSDLFAPGSGYLARLSATAEFELLRALGEFANVGFIEDGTRPVPENFASFAIDGVSLVLLFSPYQVAPYAAGPQSVRVPLAPLSDILRPAYVPE